MTAAEPTDSSEGVKFDKIILSLPSFGKEVRLFAAC
jgi:hypothetical protein